METYCVELLEKYIHERGNGLAANIIKDLGDIEDELVRKYPKESFRNIVQLVSGEWRRMHHEQISAMGGKIIKT